MVDPEGNRFAAKTVKKESLRIPKNRDKVRMSTRFFFFAIFCMISHWTFLFDGRTLNVLLKFSNDLLRYQLLAEIKIHRSMNHKNIVKFYKCFEDSENVYMLLELCEKTVRMKVIFCTRYLAVTLYTSFSV